MKTLSFLLILSGVTISLLEASPKVPRRMKFADIHLVIREDARKEIQSDVDALTKNPYYFNLKVQRAIAYFPIIERIFMEEKVPDDFKFLVLQESALISDAVSSSNAVGYWQFKDFTAQEVGMRVDKRIDERMNLVSATRGAAKYLKQNNFYFDNWLYALQAYQMGAGGVRRSVDNVHSGEKHMDITNDTYWYIKKYLAHKIAFEHAIKGSSELNLMLYHTDVKTSLKKVAETLSVNPDELKRYNKWTKTGIIPGDKQYAVLVPLKGTTRPMINNKVRFKSVDISKNNIDILPYADSPVKGNQSREVNQLLVIWPREGESLDFLAARAGMKLPSFLSCNDISSNHKVAVKLPYFMQKKKNRASEPFHNVVEGETLWEISQLYGVKLKRLRKYNNLSKKDHIRANSTLWLSDVRPDKSDKSIIFDESTVELNREDFFDWGELQVGLVNGSILSILNAVNED